ncbi:hypothetical protein FRB93_011638 [Tulasnella sp. JGI-2019a]|nr:hypothetical protein FRB93_011638 [Tulasnella sp. JGI-2019a]
MPHLAWKLVKGCFPQRSILYTLVSISLPPPNMPPQVISASNSNITYTCPPNTPANSVWAMQSAVPEGAYNQVRGSGCSMKYTFSSKYGSIAVIVQGNFDHGFYSCQLDDNPPQWFNANANANTLSKRGCFIQGASRASHNITITNGPEPGWMLSIGNITLNWSNNPDGGATSFNSDWTLVMLPAYLTTVAPPPTPSKNVISTPVFGSVAGALGLLALMAFGAAALFWRRGRQLREQLWAMDLSNTAGPLTVVSRAQRPSQEPLVPHATPPGELQQGNLTSPQPQTQSAVEVNIGDLNVEPSPAYTPVAESSTQPRQRGQKA